MSRSATASSGAISACARKPSRRSLQPLRLRRLRDSDPVLKKGFAASDQQVGIFFGISALGAIAGASLGGAFPGRWPFGRALVIAYLLDALFFLPVVLVSNIWLAAALLGDFERPRQLRDRADPRLSHARHAAREMVGRVMGAVRLFVLAGIGPGVLLFGWVADHRSPHAAMTISAWIGYIVAALVALAIAGNPQRVPLTSE